MWRFDGKSGELIPGEPAYVSLPPGDGPRHFDFHPDGRRLYVIQEEASTITVFDYDGEKGVLAERQTNSSLPPGYSGSKFWSGLWVSGVGRFVYAVLYTHLTLATSYRLQSVDSGWWDLTT